MRLITRTHAHTHTLTHAYTRMHARMHTRTHSHMHTHACTHARTQVQYTTHKYCRNIMHNIYTHMYNIQRQTWYIYFISYRKYKTQCIICSSHLLISRTQPTTWPCKCSPFRVLLGSWRSYTELKVPINAG